jgi:hypothetical protein
MTTNLLRLFFKMQEYHHLTYCFLKQIKAFSTAFCSFSNAHNIHLQTRIAFISKQAIPKPSS